jgi:hypothetical protein
MQIIHPARWTITLLIAVLLALGGCHPPGQGKKGAAGVKAKDHHAEKGPHDGVLVEWGDDEYHAEFTVDHDKKQATIYILDGKAKDPVAIDPEKVTLTITNVPGSAALKIPLKAEPQKGDTEGLASRFVGSDDKLGVEMDFKGEIAGEVKGKEYKGKFDEKEHEHKHEKK